MYRPVRDHSFANSTLLFSTIGIGNVSQLSVDIILNTLELPLVGYLDSEYLLPFAGQRALDYSDHLNCPLEVYGRDNLTIVQLRSVPMKNCWNSFLREFLAWTASQKFHNIIALGSADRSYSNESVIEAKYSSHLIGSTFVTTMLEKGIRVYLKYVYEGNNIPDAISFAEYVKELIEIKSECSLTIPVCWNQLEQ